MAFNLSRLFGGRETRSPSLRLYEAIVAQARLPELYSQSGLADTIESRFEMLALHLVVTQRCLMRQGAIGAALTRNLSESFVEDMEAVVRERGEGDLAVPKRVRQLAGELHGRAASYGAAFDDAEALGHAIAASLPLDSAAAEEAGRTLAAYARACARALEGQSFESLSRGEISFPALQDQNRDG